MPWLFLLVALVGAWFTWNAYRPIYAPAQVAVVSFFAGWLTTELAVHHIAWQLLATVVFVWMGGLAAWPGWAALAISVVSWVMLWRLLGGSRGAEAAVEQALVTGLGADYRQQIRPAVAERFAPGVDWRTLVVPFRIRRPDVERVRDITYTEGPGYKLQLDVYRNRERPQRCPTLLQVHGGGWVLGSKNEQGLPLMMHLASRGWVCVSADYRLSPRATFPDPLVDLKHAIKWIKEYGAEYGADPDFIVVTGGSAGGHLAALVGLTGNEAEYQPGFEDVDTSVKACVSFYGVYDFTDRHKHYRNPGLGRLLQRHVMKAAYDEAHDAYEKASPMSRIRPDTPPFFIIHGDRDTLVPVDEARQFFAMFKAVAPAAVTYAEIPGAQHAFEIFPSLRSAFVVNGVERFLALIYSRYLDERGVREDRAAVG